MENKIMFAEEEVKEIVTNNCGMNDAMEYGCNIEWNGHNICVKRFLPLRETMGFVDGVVAGCFAKSDNSFIPEVKDFFFRCSIVESYTNITLPESIEGKNQVIYGTDIIDKILRCIDMGQFQAIMDSIEKKLNYLVNVNVKQINDEAELVVTEMTGLYAKLQEVFSGIDKDTMAQVANAVAGTVIDEKKLVDSVIEARNGNDGLKVMK